MALVNLTLSNADWWTVADALRAFVPPDDALANIVEGEVPERGTDDGLLTTIIGLTETSQASLERLAWTPPPIWGAKIIHSNITAQINGL